MVTRIVSGLPKGSNSARTSPHSELSRLAPVVLGTTTEDAMPMKPASLARLFGLVNLGLMLTPLPILYVLWSGSARVLEQVAILVLPLIAVLMVVWVWCYFRLPRLLAICDEHLEQTRVDGAAHCPDCGLAFVNVWAPAADGDAGRRR